MPKITKEMVKEASETILEMLSQSNVDDTEGLEKLMGRTFTVKRNGEQILFNKFPSNLMTVAHGISYCVNGYGVPVEVKINAQLGYTSFIVKSECEWPGYAAWIEDPYGNLVQQKKIDTADIAGVKQELESIAKGHDLIDRSSAADRN